MAAGPFAGRPARVVVARHLLRPTCRWRSSASSSRSWRVVLNPRRTPAPIDWVGAMLIVAGIGTLVLGLQQASTWGWSSLPTLGASWAGCAHRHLRGGRTVVTGSSHADRVLRQPHVPGARRDPADLVSGVRAGVRLRASTRRSASDGELELVCTSSSSSGASHPACRSAAAGWTRARRARPRCGGGALGAAGFFCWAAWLQGLSENSQWPWIVRGSRKLEPPHSSSSNAFRVKTRPGLVSGACAAARIPGTSAARAPPRASTARRTVSMLSPSTSISSSRAIVGGSWARRRSARTRLMNSRIENGFVM